MSTILRLRDNIAKVSAGELMQKIIRAAVLEGGVTHVGATIEVSPGEERVLVLHVEIEGNYTPEEFERQLNESNEANETNPVLN